MFFDNRSLVNRTRRVLLFACVAAIPGLLLAANASSFGDDPLVSQSTVVKAEDIEEIRAAIDSVRVARGLATFTWTDPTLTPGSTPVKAVHVAELRTALNQAYEAVGQTPPAYTDPTVAKGQTVIKAKHLKELWTAVAALDALDGTRPAVSIAFPAAGATISGTVTVTASATDNVGVVGVQFKRDGVNLGAEDTTNAYSIAWNTTTIANGTHTLTAVARDAAGNTTSTQITVTVSNPDVAPPTVTITSPTANPTYSTSSTPMTLGGTASDNVGVTQVTWASSRGGSGTASGKTSWTAGGIVLQAGTNVLTVTARDAAGKTATDSVTVTLSDTTPPIVAFTAPTAGATVTGTISVTATATDNVGVGGVQFKRGGANLGAEDTTAPYSLSWNTTTATNGSHTLTALARDGAGNQTISAVTVTVANGPPPPPPPGGGLAALYPGDVGIETDPDVIFVEQFEQGTLTQVFTRWTDVLNGSAMSLAADVPPGSRGSRSLNIPWVGGGVNDGGQLYKQLSPGVDDTLYVRYYIKYPTGGQYQHTGIWMGGFNPALSYPSPQAGVKPVGDDKFIAAAEQSTQTSRFDHYAYWMNMHQSGDGNYWGNLLLNDPDVQARTGQWTCVEHMVKLNTPVTSSNGEHAIWLDGVKVSHLGQGFPKGRWSGGIFTQDPAGSPFEGFRWRSTADLNLNWIWLQNYASNAPAGFVGTMKFDHVVAARSYIGCLSSGASDTTLPAVSITAPKADSTLSGSGVIISASASDDVGVVGVQFKLDGVNLGAEDTTNAYSVSWNTAAAINGPHTLTAVARDAAGNTTTSAGITVTLSNLSTSVWPNEPTGFVRMNDQPWDALTGNGWNYLRRSASKDSTIVTDAAVPFSPLNNLRIVFTPDMQRDTEPGVHWIGVSNVREIYTGWWMKVSPNWTCSPAGCGKISFLFAQNGGQVYTNLHHQAGNEVDGYVEGPPYRITLNTEWTGIYGGQKIWYPNVTTTLIDRGGWHRIEFYYKWETTPGASDGIIRWWVDGTLNGNYTNMRFPTQPGFEEFQYAPTLQNPPSAEQYMHIDHTYMSKP